MSLWLIQNLSNSYSSRNMTRINYTLFIHGWKVSMVFTRNCFPKMKDFSRLQAVMYTVKVVVSKKWREIDTLLLHTTNRKYHMAYLVVPFSMTLDDLEGHSHNAGLIKRNFRRTLVRHLARFLLTRRVARSLGDS